MIRLLGALLAEGVELDHCVFERAAASRVIAPVARDHAPALLHESEGDRGLRAGRTGGSGEFLKREPRVAGLRAEEFDRVRDVLVGRPWTSVLVRVAAMRHHRANEMIIGDREVLDAFGCAGHRSRSLLAGAKLEAAAIDLLEARLLSLLRDLADDRRVERGGRRLAAGGPELLRDRLLDDVLAAHRLLGLGKDLGGGVENAGALLRLALGPRLGRLAARRALRRLGLFLATRRLRPSRGIRLGGSRHRPLAGRLAVRARLPLVADPGVLLVGRSNGLGLGLRHRRRPQTLGALDADLLLRGQVRRVPAAAGVLRVDANVGELVAHLGAIDAPDLDVCLLHVVCPFEQWCETKTRRSTAAGSGNLVDADLGSASWTRSRGRWPACPAGGVGEFKCLFDAPGREVMEVEVVAPPRVERRHVENALGDLLERTVAGRHGVVLLSRTQGHDLANTSSRLREDSPTVGNFAAKLGHIWRRAA